MRRLFAYQESEVPVVGQEGKDDESAATAVLLDIATWEHIVQALENAKDIPLVKQILADIDAVGGDLEKAGYISWEKARAELTC